MIDVDHGGGKAPEESDRETPSTNQELKGFNEFTEIKSDLSLFLNKAAQLAIIAKNNTTIELPSELENHCQMAETVKVATTIVLDNNALPASGQKFDKEKAKEIAEILFDTAHTIFEIKAQVCSFQSTHSDGSKGQVFFVNLKAHSKLDDDGTIQSSGLEESVDAIILGLQKVINASTQPISSIQIQELPSSTPGREDKSFVGRATTCTDGRTKVYFSSGSVDGLDQALAPVVIELRADSPVKIVSRNSLESRVAFMREGCSQVGEVQYVVAAPRYSAEPRNSRAFEDAAIGASKYIHSLSKNGEHGEHVQFNFSIHVGNAQSELTGLSLTTQPNDSAGLLNPQEQRSGLAANASLGHGILIDDEAIVITTPQFHGYGELNTLCKQIAEALNDAAGKLVIVGIGNSKRNSEQASLLSIPEWHRTVVPKLKQAAGLIVIDRSVSNLDPASRVIDLESWASDRAVPTAYFTDKGSSEVFAELVTQGGGDSNAQVTKLKFELKLELYVDETNGIGSLKVLQPVS